MDIILTASIWGGQVLRICIGWLIACLREHRLLQFDSRQLPSLGTVAALGGGAGFVSAFLPGMGMWPDKTRIIVGVIVGLLGQVLFRDMLKGLDQEAPLTPES